MIIYRPHKGSLIDSMVEAIEFNNEQEMKERIVEYWDNNFSIDDIVFDNELINDNRNGWKNSRYVCIKRFGEVDYITKFGCPQCIGMCATEY